MTPYLPHEIHELICSYLEASSLLEYSLICHQFHSIAQKSIFAKVELIYPRPGEHTGTRTENLLQLTADSAGIREAIRTICLVDKRTMPRFPYKSMPDFWDDLALCFLLSHLKNITQFGMDNLAYMSSSWKSIPPVIQDAITTTIHSDLITNLVLYAVVLLPLDVLDGCTALEELSLEFVTFQQKEMEQVLAGSWKPHIQRKREARLKTLRLNLLSDPFFRFFSVWITSSNCNLVITHLKRVSIMLVDSKEFTGVNQILQRCARTVEIFCFQPRFRMYKVDVPTDPIDISSLTSLRILRLHLQLMSLGSSNIFRYASCSSWISNFFMSLPLTSSVTEISLKVSLHMERELTGVPGLVDMAMWSVLDSLLANHTTQSLRRVTLIGMTEECDVPGDIERQIKQSFPKLDEAQALVVETSDAIQGFFSTPQDKDLFVRAEVY